MNRPLTNQQQIVYDFIRDKIVGRGYGPTVREIGEHMNIKSPNGVMCHLRALERKGMIVRTANKSRAIELTEPIERAAATRLLLGGAIHQAVCQWNPPDSSAQVDLSGLFEGPEKFALQVQDDSLMDVSIRRGDLVIAERREQAQSGQLALVQLLDAGGRLLPHLRFVFIEDGRYRLQAPNRALPTIEVDQLDVMGVVVGLVRKFANV